MKYHETSYMEKMRIQREIKSLKETSQYPSKRSGLERETWEVEGLAIEHARTLGESYIHRVNLIGTDSKQTPTLTETTAFTRRPNIDPNSGRPEIKPEETLGRSRKGENCGINRSFPPAGIRHYMFLEGNQDIKVEILFDSKTQHGKDKPFAYNGDYATESMLYRLTPISS